MHLTMPSRALPLLVLVALHVALASGQSAAAPAPDYEGAHSPAAEDGDDGHSHGLEPADFAAEALELGSVDAARAELCGQQELESYDMGLHIGAVFIVAAVSALGSLAPLALTTCSSSDGVRAAVRMGTYFGFGTILATALIHTLLPAAESLSSPCLPESWRDAYEGWAYLFVLITIIFMQLADYLLEGAYQRYLDRTAAAAGAAAPPPSAHGEQLRHAAVVGAIAGLHAGPDEEAGVKQAADSESATGTEGGTCAVHGDGCETLMGGAHKRDPSHIVGVCLLEAGIIFHSVLIGITLGVTGGSEFTALLVAISFHQLFEGFAIGSALVEAGVARLKVLLAGLAYTLTTPVGVAVGIGIRASFNENSTTTLLVQGIFDSVSSGILLYVVLVELLNPLMTQSVWLRSRGAWTQALAFACFWAGAGLMALIGVWA